MSTVIVIPNGTQGIKGDRGDSNLIKYNFAYGDATPTPITTINGRIVSIRVVIDEVFNGLNPLIFVGDSFVSDRLIQANQIDPKTLLTYGNYQGFFYNVSTQILLTIFPGSGASTGKGTIIIEV
jgi:hypothetical protein